MTIGRDDDELFACPITGSLEYNEAPAKAASREVKEESGYDVNITDSDLLNISAIGTQTNELCFLYYKLVSGGPDVSRKNDGSYFESISKNVWEPLENLKNYNYSGCQIGYYKLKEILK